MKVQVICFWVLIPQRPCVRVSGRSRGRKTSVTVMRVSVNFDQMHWDRLCVGGCPTQEYSLCMTKQQQQLKKEDICICAWTFRFDWLCACVFLVRECEFERQYLRAAGSPKVSSFHPWLGSTAACLQSVSSLGLEENRAYVAAILPFVRLFSTFILCL